MTSTAADMQIYWNWGKVSSDLIKILTAALTRSNVCIWMTYTMASQVICVELMLMTCKMEDIETYDTLLAVASFCYLLTHDWAMKWECSTSLPFGCMMHWSEAKVKAKAQVLGIAPLNYAKHVPAALYNRGSGDWSALAIVAWYGAS